MNVQNSTFQKFDPARVPSPCFVVDEVAVERNLEILASVASRSNAKILLALKAFSMYHFGPLVGRYLSGVCASGLHEALLGKEFYTGEVHTFSPGFCDSSLGKILKISDHVVFNSIDQWNRFQAQVTQASRLKIQFGLRINPEHSEGSVSKYDPCAEH